MIARVIHRNVLIAIPCLLIIFGEENANDAQIAANLATDDAKSYPAKGSKGKTHNTERLQCQVMHHLPSIMTRLIDCAWLATEEQLMEVEALESIYPTEFEMITSDPLCYKLHLVPNPSGDGEPNHGIRIFIRFPSFQF